MLEPCRALREGWGLIDLPLRASLSPAHPLADIFYPSDPPITEQSISRDVPCHSPRRGLLILQRESADCF